MVKRSRKPEQAAGKSADNGNSGEKKVNKSAAIRTYFKAHKKAMPKEVVAALKAQGIEVSPNMVSMVKATAKVKKAHRKAKEAVADGSITAAQRGNSAGLDAALVLYKAARGQEVAPAKVRQSFLLLVETLG